MRGVTVAGRRAGRRAPPVPGFEMTAHYDDDIDFTFMTGWNSKKTPYSGPTPKGSVSGDLSADGGTVVSLTTDGFAAVVVEGPNSGLTNINIDGTDYALTIDTAVGGQTSYTFTYGGFTDGQTYQVVLS